VREGTYLERIELRLFTYLYGGFSGIETYRAQRNWKTHICYLDGQQSGSVVIARLIDSFSTIDGFTIQNQLCSANSRFGGDLRRCVRLVGLPAG
jgi:hypothetical protein